METPRGPAESGRDLARTAGDRTPGQEEDPTISVVVASYVGRQRLAGLVDEVLADTAVAELVVVVDGCDDGSFELLCSLALDHDRLLPIRIDHAGQLTALETGAKAASSELVLLLDDDVIPRPGLARGHAATHAGRSGIVVLGSMSLDGALDSGGPRTVWDEVYSSDYENQCDHFLAGDDVLANLWLGNVSMRREDCLRIGLYSPLFPYHYHADQDLGLRLGAGGLVGEFAPQLAATHRRNHGMWRFVRDARDEGFGLVWLHHTRRRSMPPFDTGALLESLSRPLRAAVLAASAPGLAKPAGYLAASGAAGLDRLGLRSAALALARFARKVLQRDGARAALRVAADERRAG